MTMVNTIVNATPAQGEASHPLWRRHPGQSHAKNAVGQLCVSTYDLDIDTCDAECRVCWGDEDAMCWGDEDAS